MGQYDAILISEFPSDEALTKFTPSAGAAGNISTETLRAFLFRLRPTIELRHVPVTTGLKITGVRGFVTMLT